MQFIPIKTRILQPPQDDLLAAIIEQEPIVKNGDIFIISSKVVSIHEGRAVPRTDSTKTKLIEKEADIIIPRAPGVTPLTVTRHTFLSAAGIDESNGGGYYILLPEDCFRSAAKLHQALRLHFGLTDCGVIIIDSRSNPFRYGATGVALGWWGIKPLDDHRGRKDLFGRSIKVERSNVVDGLAAGATVLMGEVDECIPVVIARDVPRIIYTDSSQASELFAGHQDDIFSVLYERWLK